MVFTPNWNANSGVSPPSTWPYLARNAQGIIIGAASSIPVSNPRVSSIYITSAKNTQTLFDAQEFWERVAHERELALSNRRTEDNINIAQLNDANTKIEDLESQIKEVKHYEIDDTDVRMLLLTANATYDNPFAEFFAETLNLHIEVIKHRLNKLTKHKYLRELGHESGLPVYQLHYKGREYLIQNKLI